MTQRACGFLSLCLVVAACSPQDGDDGSQPDRSDDICQDEGRYADGRCDRDCPLPDPDCDDHGLDDITGGDAPLCLAYRGNGPRIPAHFGATARILENYGLASAAAGGSSGSITTFLLESVMRSPIVRCAGCSGEEQALRAALAFKTMPALIALAGQREDIVAVRTLTELADTVKEQGIAELLSLDGLEGVAALRAILASPDFRDLVNPEVVDLLVDSPDPVFHARDILSAIAAGFSFEVDDATAFLRPGVLDFGAVAERFGLVADFYAGYGPLDAAATEAFFAACATGSKGQAWEEIGPRSEAGLRCDERFAQLVTSYVEAWRRDQGSFVHRIDERVGAHLPTLVTTAVLEGEATQRWQRARADYAAAREVSLSVSFEEVGIGYFGSARDLGWAIGNPFRFEDDKSRRARSLGQVTWREALSASPAEPGMARGVELAGDRVSVGGWSDPLPTLVLRNLGCERIAVVSRRGGVGGFTEGVATLLGADAQDLDALFGLENPESSFYRSLDEADAISCSNWDGPDVGDLQAVTATGWNAPIESTDPFFAGPARAPTQVDTTGLPGCTPGLAAD
jgi:hypothetical protein